MSDASNPSGQPGMKVAARLVIWDFDGTVSLLRAGWAEIMSGLFLEKWRATVAPQAPDAEQARLQQDLLRLNGHPPIHQMMDFADQVRRRGGTPESPEAYHQAFQERLSRRIQERLEESRLQGGDAGLVPGARRLLECLQQAGVQQHLLSGTARTDLLVEVTELRLTTFFPPPHIHGPGPDDTTFRKAFVMEQLQRSTGFSPNEIACIGDGRVEMVEANRLGFFTLGVACPETELPHDPGALDPSKLAILQEAGAQSILRDYLDTSACLHFLGHTLQPS